ncbi:MAG TPA: DUF3006 domain-containing protein [Bacillota bacterium]|nr:DUF3006 domain-containing protein [Bacillota bacterium]
MKKYTVDSISEGKATLLLREDEAIHVVVDTNELPKNVAEGHILNVSFTEENKVKQVDILKEETERAKERAEALLQKILDKNK